MKINLLSLTVLLMQLSISCVAFANQNYVQTNTSISLAAANINSIQNAIQNHQITCEQLVTAYLDRIKKYDLSVNSKPPINAISEINPALITDARHLDEIYSKTHKLVGPLHCVPVILKDNIDYIDGTTTAGSLALLGNHPTQDAFIVTQFRNAGAIILGHGAMDEFASGMYGVSSRSGRIGNAYEPWKNPGGSSGGPAAAVSASFACVGIGTDNSGSIRVPAAFNGIVGLRPSTGLLSQQGIFPMGNLDGVVGPLTNNVSDIALVLDVIARPDTKDPKTLTVPRVKTYTAFLNVDGLRGKRIGIVRLVDKVNTFKNMRNPTLSIFQNSVQKMQQLGATVIDIELPQFNTYRKLNMAGTFQDVNAYLITHPTDRKNFQDICKSNKTRAFGNVQECLKLIRKTPTKYSPQYYQALTIFKNNRNYVQSVMNKYHLDALLIPISTNGSATYQALKINSWQASVSSNAGLPSIVFNIGYDQKNNMPIGVELIGRQFDEGTLIEMAYSYEQHSLPRKIPVMPNANTMLENLSIAKLNHLFTQLGADAYEEVLKNGRTGEFAYRDLTAEKFKTIVKVDLIKIMK